MKSYDDLVKKYPQLYSKGMYFECDIGWYDLIDELSAKIEPLLEKLNLENEEKAHATQVKEKYGSLRFYISGGTDEIFKIIDEYEMKSEEICEVCGKKGKLIHGPWITTLCDEHFISGNTTDENIPLK